MPGGRCRDADPKVIFNYEDGTTFEITGHLRQDCKAADYSRTYFKSTRVGHIDVLVVVISFMK
jgi:hypothetical protein